MRRSEGTGPWERSDGRWEAQYVDATGQRRSVYAPTERDAKRRLRAKLDERDQGVAGGATTVGAWVDDWLAGQSKAPTTMANRRYLASLLPDWFRRLTLADDTLTPQHVARLLDELAATPTVHGKPRAPKTVLEVRAMLRTCLRKAQRWGLLSRNAADLVDPPELDDTEVDYLTLTEARALLDAVAGHRLESLYTVALAHGVRESEAIGARWSNVNLDEGWLKIWPTITRTSEEEVFEGVTKTRRPRRFQLTEQGIEQLRAHRARLAEERLALGPAWTDSDLVWPSSVGTPLRHRNLLRHLQERVGVKAGLRLITVGDTTRSSVTFHLLRHSAATLLLAQGVDSRVVMEILGHTSAAMMRRYQHVVEDLKSDAATAIGDALRPQPPSPAPSDSEQGGQIRRISGGGDRI